MSETKWTPEPWQTDGSDIFGSDHDHVATVNAFPVESIANASLIAAAPDLYAALEAAEKTEAALIMEWADFWDVVPTKLFDAIMEAQSLRNAALAKARGEQ